MAFPGLRRLLGLSWADRWLLLKAWVFLVAVRVALWVLPFGATRALLARWSATAPARLRRRRDSRSRLAWAVRTAGRLVPARRPCLAEALVVDTLLARRGHPRRLEIGVARDGDGIAAHAWVESDGVVVIGEAERERYTALRARGGSPLSA